MGSGQAALLRPVPLHAGSGSAQGSHRRLFLPQAPSSPPPLPPGQSCLRELCRRPSPRCSPGDGRSSPSKVRYAAAAVSPPHRRAALGRIRPGAMSRRAPLGCGARSSRGLRGGDAATVAAAPCRRSRSAQARPGGRGGGQAGRGRHVVHVRAELAVALHPGGLHHAGRR